MATTNTFGYKNVTDQAAGIVPKKLGITTNYGLQKETPTEVIMANKTSPFDTSELVSFRNQPVKKVISKIESDFVQKNKSGVQYGVRLDEILTHLEDDGDRVDLPIILNFTVTHNRNGYITDEMIDELVHRFLGGLYDDNGVSRLGDLMRQCLRPSAS